MAPSAITAPLSLLFSLSNDDGKGNELKDGKYDTAAASVKEEEEDKVVSISASVSVPVDKVSHVLP
jgi:hypothetical protein